MKEGHLKWGLPVISFARKVKNVNGNLLMTLQVVKIPMTMMITMTMTMAMTMTTLSLDPPESS